LLAKAAKMVDSDVLVQNSGFLLAEAAELIISAMRIAPDQSHGDLTKDEARKIAWQVATVIGTTFVYASNCAGRLKEKRQDIKDRTTKTVDLVISAVGLSSSVGPVPSAATDTSAVLATSLASLVGNWLVRSKESFDLEEFAADLAYLSDSIRLRAKSGMMVPGFPEREEDSGIRSADETSDYAKRRLGESFAKAFADYLSDYKVHQLQANLRRSL
jgi:hypothetical protein